MQFKNMTALRAVATVLAYPFRAFVAAPRFTLNAPSVLNPDAAGPLRVTVPAMPRAIVASGVRADGADAPALLRQLNGAFEEFKSTHEREIAEIKAGKTDVLTKDKLDAINATLTRSISGLPARC